MFEKLLKRMQLHLDVSSNDYDDGDEDVSKPMESLHGELEVYWGLPRFCPDSSNPFCWEEVDLSPTGMKFHLRMYNHSGRIRFSVYGQGRYPSEILIINSLNVNGKFIKKWTRRSSYEPRPYNQPLDDDGLMISIDGVAALNELQKEEGNTLNIQTVIHLAARGEMGNTLVAQRHICLHDSVELKDRSKMISHLAKTEGKIHWAAIEGASPPKVPNRVYRHCHDVMERLRSEPDCLLVMGDAEIPCSSTVLSLFSPFFKAMFSSQFSEAKTRRIELKVLSSLSLPKFVDFIFTGSIGHLVDREELLELLDAAHVYQIPSLFDEVETQLCGQLTPEILCFVILKAVQFERTTLKEKCILFYQNANSVEKQAILNSAEWTTIRLKYPEVLPEMLIPKPAK